MNLTLYFRLIMIVLFQRSTKLKYEGQLFYNPTVYAKDGFSISLQTHFSNYCSSENGYREFGHTMTRVEWGFPNQDEPMLVESAEDKDNITNTVGSIEITILEEIFQKHGGIDWDKTISIEQFDRLIKG